MTDETRARLRAGIEIVVRAVQDATQPDVLTQGFGPRQALIARLQVYEEELCPQTARCP